MDNIARDGFDLDVTLPWNIKIQATKPGAAEYEK
jgi:hypothetical protein